MTNRQWIRNRVGWRAYGWFWLMGVVLGLLPGLMWVDDGRSDALTVAFILLYGLTIFVFWALFLKSLVSRLSCPRCHGHLIPMPDYGKNFLTALPKTARFCPFCGLDFDAEYVAHECASRNA